MKQDHSSFASDRVTPAPDVLDYPRLVAVLAAHQASTRTARAATELEGLDHPATPVAALAAVIEGHRGWTAAAAVMAGRFHGDVPVDAPSTDRSER